MNTKKVIITGGPGTGKSTLINELLKRDYICFEEVSRQVTLDAKKNGIEQLFLTNPLLFSKLLLKERKKQYLSTDTIEANIVFFDRGIPDILAYMDFIGTNYPDSFINTCKESTYDTIFILKPWEAIYKSDNERYENFNQAQDIHKHLVNTYQAYNYKLIDVPFDSVNNRANFILNNVNM